MQITLRKKRYTNNIRLNKNKNIDVLTLSPLIAFVKDNFFFYLHL